MAVKLTDLRLEVLGCLAYNGKLSKSMVERILEKHTHIKRTDRPVKHHRKEILAVFQFLRYNRLIKKINADPGPGLVFRRGRPKIYYKITYEGLKLLIIEDPHPLKFWKAVFGYCHHNDNKISLSVINELCHLFFNTYLKFLNHGFSFQLDIFDNMCNKWLDELILNSAAISVYQKVIEVLALYPKLTLDELAKKTKENKSQIGKALSIYTLNSFKPLKENTVYIYQDIVGKKYNKKYWDFLLKSSITAKKNNDGIETYELSLFGIILALRLVRLFDKNVLRHGLYYREISFADYYDTIASNYQHKLPLIFGKWKLLKDILRLFSAYNFDIILDKEIRLKDSNRISILRGGNKELTDGIQEIVLEARQQLEEFANVGSVVWLNYITEVKYEWEGPRQQDYDYMMDNDVNVQGRPDPQKVYAPIKKLNEIILSLNPIEGLSRSTDQQPEVIEEISHQMEELFADEITALYYFNLYFEYDFNTRISESAKYSDNNNTLSPISSKPKSCLFSIIHNDKEKPLLLKWFHGWMHAIFSLQTELYEALKMG